MHLLLQCCCCFFAADSIHWIFPSAAAAAAFFAKSSSPLKKRRRRTNRLQRGCQMAQHFGMHVGNQKIIGTTAHQLIYEASFTDNLRNLRSNGVTYELPSLRVSNKSLQFKSTKSGKPSTIGRKAATMMMMMYAQMSCCRRRCQFRIGTIKFYYTTSGRKIGKISKALFAPILCCYFLFEERIFMISVVVAHSFRR